MSLDLDRITHPLRLAVGSHVEGSGEGCAMNVISYINGDTKITDYPECSARPLARMVQVVNDELAGMDGYLSPENSVKVLDLGWLTVGTADVSPEVQWQWLADLLIDPTHGAIRYAGPGFEPANRVAVLCQMEASGLQVNSADWSMSASETQRVLLRAKDDYYSVSVYDIGSTFGSISMKPSHKVNVSLPTLAAANVAYSIAVKSFTDAAAYAMYTSPDHAAYVGWAIQHLRDLAGLDDSGDVAPQEVDAALARIGV